MKGKEKLPTSKKTVTMLRKSKRQKERLQAQKTNVHQQLNLSDDITIKSEEEVPNSPFSASTPNCSRSLNVPFVKEEPDDFDGTVDIEYKFILPGGNEDEPESDHINPAPEQNHLNRIKDLEQTVANYKSENNNLKQEMKLKDLKIMELSEKVRKMEEQQHTTLNSSGVNAPPPPIVYSLLLQPQNPIIQQRNQPNPVIQKNAHNNRTSGKNSKNELKKAKEKVLLIDKPYVCEMNGCKKRFYKYYMLLDHQDCKHSDNPKRNKCDICHKVFSCDKTLQRHHIIFQNKCVPGQRYVARPGKRKQKKIMDTHQTKKEIISSQDEMEFILGK